MNDDKILNRISAIEDKIVNLEKFLNENYNYKKDDKSTESEFLKTIISVEEAISRKKKGEYDGADWYYYRGFLNSGCNSYDSPWYKYKDYWIVPKSFLKQYNVENTTFPAFYKNK